ncbi:MAG: hypothetical protein K0R48_656 [Gammaproteobacteria bacterium]|jgi:hypothetical protein|nr:hypothetical protein [Gammaproteobacteria bacterium]
MLRYPSNKEKGSYLHSQIVFYHASYSMFPEKAIRKPIERVLLYIESILGNDLLVPTQREKFENAKSLAQLFDLTKEQFGMIKRRPEAIFNALFYLVKGEPHIVKHIISQGGGIEFPTLEEGNKENKESKEKEAHEKKYLEFIAEMTKKCVKEIATEFIMNSPESKTEKTARLASDSVISPLSTKKRPREEDTGSVSGELEVKRHEKTFNR